jgi:hypothetical protein
MAHFAELDSNNVVLRVVVIDNKDTADASGIEKEHIGAAFCERLFGGIWKQTSYNGNIRKNFAGIGYSYMPAPIDGFAAPRPYSSWNLDPDDCQWVAPVPMPTDGQMYSWNEESQSWEVTDGN